MLCTVHSTGARGKRRRTHPETGQRHGETEGQTHSERHGEKERQTHTASGVG